MSWFQGEWVVQRIVVEGVVLGKLSEGEELLHVQRVIGVKATPFQEWLIEIMLGCGVGGQEVVQGVQCEAGFMGGSCRCGLSRAVPHVDCKA